MTNTVDIKVPDLGGATDVEVIDVLVSVGDEIQAEDSLITVESDKASMDIPAPMAGKVSKIAVATGDTVNVDDLVITIEAVSYTHLRAHETREDLVCRLLLEKKK